MKYRNSLLGLMVLLFFLAYGCTPKMLPENDGSPISEELIDEQPVKEDDKAICASYVRNGIEEEHCATCGNDICEPFEKCTPISCGIEGACTRDCGPLYCPDDCPEQEVPQLKPNKLPEITASLRTCNKDDDCVKVSASCCGCSAGGDAAALSKEKVAMWEKTLEVKCAGVACTAVMSNDWTCFAEPKCVKNKCTLVGE